MIKVKVIDSDTPYGLSKELEKFLANHKHTSINYSVAYKNPSTIYSALVTYKQEDVSIDSLAPLKAKGFLRIISLEEYITLKGHRRSVPLSTYKLNLNDGDKIPPFFKDKPVIAISPTGNEPYYSYNHPEHIEVNGGLPSPHFAFKHKGNYYEYWEEH